MGFNIGKVMSVASKIATGADIASKISGIDMSSINPSSIGSIQSTIESALNGSASSMMSDLQSAITTGDIESMASQFDIEGKAQELTSSIQSGSFDESQIESMLNLSGINFM